MSQDTACYREAHIMDVCPSNYDRNEATNTCWIECPIEYPVECGMECIRQNDDCGIEVASKFSAFGITVLSSATFGAFGALEILGKKVWWAAGCSTLVMASDRKILLLLFHSSIVVTDLPLTIAVCMKMRWMLSQALAHDDSIILSWQRFRAFLKGANFTEAVEKITKGEIKSLETAMKKNSSCGGELKSLVDRVWLTVNEYREENPAITDDEVRLKITDSDLVLHDIAVVTNNCMHQMIAESNQATAYKTREVLRKTFGVIMNDLIKSGKSDNGTSYDDKEKAYRVVDLAFTAAAVTLLDPTRITLFFSEFIQKICGPTQFMGEIDDGTKPATLGLNTLQKAFKGTTSSWTKKGDGAVIIKFSSTRHERRDCEHHVGRGQDRRSRRGTGEWNSTVKALGGNTLYLDRWRPGFLGLPGTGGGSLVLWVPRSSQGGHLELKVKQRELKLRSNS
ncbi:uncharacterized protein PITG_15353 [Phytophthora infestans T30-4]|uniref:Uncharacterized protein n=1 Tax=Phytophthora infestans (strain T30-4) TaxID=403677 RepID=D0NQH8_PHYIT|nr:uncharacterized protein PITG_15353 [Phytophthora infestans T30-4]EEY62910.1 conserved hypothetical protein [Phytophthora infestans T30-4]|eukprot:XP_002898785.1 conserved hypothetical protein [Phytophthora infestans T30-4]